MLKITQRQTQRATMSMECQQSPAQFWKATTKQIGQSAWRWIGVLIALAYFTVQPGSSLSAQSAASAAAETNRLGLVATDTPIIPVFEVHRYEVIGSTALNPSELDEIMRNAIGTNVSLPQIRRGLVRLQEAYRERGLTKVSVTLPRQPLINGVVKVQIVGSPDASGRQTPPPLAHELKTWSVPTYDIQHFEVRGNSLLKAEEIDAIIDPLAGPAVSVEQIQKGLSKLQETFHARGYTRATVSLPEQLLTDGTVAIQINEGKSLQAETAAFAARAVPASVKPPPPARTFEVRRYEVLGNTLLDPQILDQTFTNALGAHVSLAQIQKALGDLQLAYRERGFATVSVSLPQQQLTNAMVKVQVTEGALVDVRVMGNRHFSSNNIARALPSLSTNVQLNSKVFQRELDIANQNRDRQIYPTIGPGPEPGTSALTLRVKDRLPLHGRIDLNNQSTPGTPDWRINASLTYGNLWDREHQLGLSYGFTPEEYKSGGLVSDYFFNRPLIANGGFYYRLPFGEASSVQEQIAGSSGRFGYDEATHQFRLPPAGTRPDLTFYGSTSSSDTGVKFSPVSVVSKNVLLTILSQDSGQNITLNDSAGGRLNIPLPVDDNRRWSFSGGLDLKRYALESYNTNNFSFITVITNAQGSQTNVTRLPPSPQPVRRTDVTYLPLSLNADYFQTDQSGTFSASLGYSWNFVGEDKDFAAASYSSKTKAQYAKTTLSLTRDQRIFEDWSLLLRGSGQVATGPLISNEQFAMGGVNSVRGYFEGDGYGDMGWFGSAELRTPFISTQVPIGSGSVPAWLRGSVFVDASQRYFVKPPPGGDPFRTQIGTGFGVSANIDNHMDVRITVGWPLRDSANTSAYDPRIHFSLGGQF